MLHLLYYGWGKDTELGEDGPLSCQGRRIASSACGIRFTLPEDISFLISSWIDTQEETGLKTHVLKCMSCADDTRSRTSECSL